MIGVPNKKIFYDKKERDERIKLYRDGRIKCSIQVALCIPALITVDTLLFSGKGSLEAELWSGVILLLLTALCVIRIIQYTALIKESEK